MIVIPGRIPIAIHPIFWLFAALIGWINSQSLIGMLVWVLIILVSVLFHELGHALSALFFGQSAKIELVALGGVTSYEGPKLNALKQFIIVFNGPLFGFFLFLGAGFLLKLGTFSPFVFSILKITQIANLFWTVVNLLPILPLDGGQLLRIVLEASFGIRGLKISLFLGALFAVSIALFFFFLRYFLVGALFFLFAFQSYVSWRRSRFITQEDREDEVKTLLMEGEKALSAGKKEAAISAFEKVVSKAKQGLVSSLAREYLAVLLVDQGQMHQAYEYLLPIEDHLRDETKLLLHKLAEGEKNYALIAKLSQECYQLSPTQEVAFRNARGFAYLKEPKLAGGWLMRAFEHSPFDVQALLAEEPFSSIQNDPEFQKFLPK